MKKKALIMVLCAALVITSAALGTIAYLTDRASITNVFTMGNVQIKVDETDVDLNGDPIPDENGAPVRKEEGNEYHLIPGKTYTKDPAVTVLRGGEDTFVRMIVTITDAADVLAVFEELKAFYPEYANGFLPQEHVTGWLPEIWPCHDMRTDTANDAIVLEFRYHRVVAADPANDQMLEPLFASFTVPGELTGDQLDRIKEMQIIVEGHAIQTATFETEDDAWAAFDDQETATTLVDPPVEEEQPPVVPAP